MSQDPSLHQQNYPNQAPSGSLSPDQYPQGNISNLGYHTYVPEMQYIPPEQIIAGQQMYTEPAIASQPSKAQSAWKYILETLLYMLVIVISVVIIRYVFVSPFQVDGSSMEPNLSSGELILVNKIGYSRVWDFVLHEPQRGDVVVVVPPDDAKRYYVKRIIALPGETIQFYQGDVYVSNDENPEGFKLHESYLSEENKITLSRDMKGERLSIPVRNYFVMGDNRSESRDSRSFGPINRQNIVGKVEAIMFPFEKASLLEDPIYVPQ